MQEAWVRIPAVEEKCKWAKVLLGLRHLCPAFIFLGMTTDWKRVENNGFLMNLKLNVGEWESQHKNVSKPV